MKYSPGYVVNEHLVKKAPGLYHCPFRMEEQAVQDTETRPTTKQSGKAEVLVGGSSTKYRLIKKIGQSLIIFKYF